VSHWDVLPAALESRYVVDCSKGPGTYLGACSYHLLLAYLVWLIRLAHPASCGQLSVRLWWVAACELQQFH
jgi:hypothetical protein